MYEPQLTLHRAPATDYARISSRRSRTSPATSREMSGGMPAAARPTAATPAAGRAGVRGLVLGSGRGRVARVAVLAAMLLAVMTLVFARVAGAEGRPTYDTVVVQPGDTLWSIAAAHYPSDDPRARVDDIERTNHLPDPIVHAGQRLLLPRPN